MIGWSFPSNNYGQTTGLNDAGIETFKGNTWDSLAREINQNSCDAKGDDSTRPVEVEFKLELIKRTDIPGHEQFVQILESCFEFWKGNAKTEIFFSNAVKLMSEDRIPFLKISDFNTTGLTGSSELDRGGWHNLIKSVGSSDKGSKSGGSFGIGKHAPFACSQLRTVYYGTLDKNGNRAFQGVSKLVTHNGSNGEPTQGTGYFGIKDRNSPIHELEGLHTFFKREEMGTDIFVAGFMVEADWEIKVIKSVLENFFVSILEQKLVVKVGDTLINSATMAELINRYIRQDSDCLSASYFDAYTLSNRHYFYEENFLGLGRIELFVLPGKDLPKRVAMVRQTGMKIYDKGNFRTPFKFAGVMIAKGDELNSFLRQLEPPTHIAWEAERHDDPELAKSRIRSLYAWINDKVKSIAIQDNVEELDVEGLGDHLPDYVGDDQPVSMFNSPNKQPLVSKEIELDIVRRPMATTVLVVNEEVAATSDQSVFNSEDEETNSESGDENSDKDSNNEENDDDVTDDNVVEKPEQKNDERKNDAPKKSLKLKHLRVFCTNALNGEYKISVQSDDNGLGYLSVKIAGEVGGELANIKSAVMEGMQEPLNVGDGRVGPISFLKDKKCNVIIKLQRSKRCALEVSIHAN
ncbi:hypothetical protein [Paenibacillus luteus]|uniref:hypothetical protein n=1 Tax=Paenibacillus luteus TaxID=2545753 RepID=UPI001142D506|nr:hypothetical protein [Paenibacillus luteus]